MPPVMDHKSSRERCRQGWELRRRGRTWEEIADELGWKSRASACTAVRKWLEKNPPDDLVTMRRATGDTLLEVVERVLDTLEVAQQAGKTRDVAELAKVAIDGADRYAKLTGQHVVVAQQVDVTVHQSPAEVIASTRERLLAALQSEQQNALPAPDIVDAEIVESPEQETA